jgi:RNA recognition motif-containing protein
MNIDANTTEDELLEAFKKHSEGAYKAKLLYDKEGASKGVAYVEYNSPADAKSAVSSCQSIELGSRKLLVQMARQV